jgi:AhpD family alkylhydroperoxidase
MERANYAALASEPMKALGGVHAYLHHKTDLPAGLIDLVFLRVSQINGCAYCIDMHSRDLIKAGMTVEKLVLVPVWHEAGTLFSEQERAALKWAEVVTEVAETHVPDDAYTIASAVFAPKDLVDLTVAVSLMNAYNRLGVAFRMKPAAAA